MLLFLEDIFLHFNENCSCSEAARLKVHLVLLDIGLEQKSVVLHITRVDKILYFSLNTYFF